MPTLQAMVAALAELPPAVAVVPPLQAVIETANAPTAKAVAIRVMRDIVFLSESRRQRHRHISYRWERLPRAIMFVSARNISPLASAHHRVAVTIG
jgi:hypothetical protein